MVFASQILNMNIKTIKYLTVIAMALTVGGITSQVGATTISIGDNRDLGLISKNQPADPSSSTDYLNILLSQSLGSGPIHIGSNDYTRTMNNPLAGNYPTAVFGLEYGAVTDIDLGSGFLYLLAKYDGPNWGSEVWYVGGLTGHITIPQFGSGNQYGVSHVYLFNGTPPTVPDGGTTAMLLGSACGALALVRRFCIC